MGPFAAVMGMNFLSGIMSYGADKAQAKAARAYQAYRNTMTKLSDAMNQNSITENEIMSNAQFAKQAVEIKQNALAATGTTEVQAAAAGVKGRSVRAQLFDVQRNANIAEGARQENLRQSWLSFDISRQQSAMSAAMQQDYSYIPKPNFMTYMLKSAIGGASQGISAGMIG